MLEKRASNLAGAGTSDDAGEPPRDSNGDDDGAPSGAKMSSGAAAAIAVSLLVLLAVGGGGFWWRQHKQQEASVLRDIAGQDRDRPNRAGAVVPGAATSSTDNVDVPSPARNGQNSASGATSDAASRRPAALPLPAASPASGSIAEIRMAVVERGDVVYNSNDAGGEPSTSSSSMQQHPRRSTRPRTQTGPLVRDPALPPKHSTLGTSRRVHLGLCMSAGVLPHLRMAVLPHLTLSTLCLLRTAAWWFHECPICCTSLQTARRTTGGRWRGCQT